MSKKFSWWRLPLLIALAVLAWVIIFPAHLDLIHTAVEETKLQNIKDHEQDSVHMLVNDITELSSICDSRLAQFGNEQIVPEVSGCTKKACEKENPCCNTCEIMWRIPAQNKTLFFRHEPPANCKATECGIERCKKEGYKISQLQAKDCFKNKSR